MNFTQALALQEDKKEEWTYVIQGNIGDSRGCYGKTENKETNSAKKSQ